MVQSLPAAEVVHALPGRTRLRVASRRGDAAFFAAVTPALKAVAGVEKVDVSPLTGSILIQHFAPLSSITAAARSANLFAAAQPDIGETVAAPLHQEQRIAITPRQAVAVALWAIVLWQAFQGRLFPASVTAAWYAARVSGFLPMEGFPGDSE